MTSFIISNIPTIYFLAANNDGTEVNPQVALWTKDGAAADAMTLVDSWENQAGIYLFFGQTDAVEIVSDEVLAAVSDRIYRFLQTPSLQKTRFLWIEPLGAAVSDWTFRALTLSAENVVERQTFINFRNYELVISAGVVCQINDLEDGFEFGLDPARHSLPGSPLVAGKPAPFYFSTGYGEQQHRELGKQFLLLPADGSLAGCFVFDLTLRNYDIRLETLENDEALASISETGEPRSFVVARTGTTEDYAYHAWIFDRDGNRIVRRVNEPFVIEDSLLQEALERAFERSSLDDRFKDELIWAIAANILTLDWSQYKLRLLNSSDRLPETVSREVVVTKAGKFYSASIFDGNGELMIGRDFGEFLPTASLVNELDALFDTAADEVVLTDAAVDLRVIPKVVASLKRSLIEPFDALSQMDISLRMFFKSGDLLDLDLEAAPKYSEYSPLLVEVESRQAAIAYALPADVDKENKVLIIKANSDYRVRIFGPQEDGLLFDESIEHFLSDITLRQQLEKAFSGVEQNKAPVEEAAPDNEAATDGGLVVEKTISRVESRVLIERLFAALDIFDDTDLFSGFGRSAFSTLRQQDDYLISYNRYPLLGESGSEAYRYQSLTLYATLDPVAPLVTAAQIERTYFAFSPPVVLEIPPFNQFGRSLPSGYRSNTGYTMHLTPHNRGDNPSRLIFAESPGQGNGQYQPAFYLVPKGRFALSLPDYSQAPITAGDRFPMRANGENNLLCGLSGIEYIKLLSDPKMVDRPVNTLIFEPGKPAFAEDFVPYKVADTEGAPQRISLGPSGIGSTTTAWAYVEYEQSAPEETPVYFSQPRQSLLYAASDASADQDGDPTNNPLRFLPVSAARLRPRSTQAVQEKVADYFPYFPLLPYGGVMQNEDVYQQMEEQVLNPKRRVQIRRQIELFSKATESSGQSVSELGASRSVVAAAPTNVVARSVSAEKESLVQTVGTTPQGLLATYESDDAADKFKVMKTLLLAKDTDGDDFTLNKLARGLALRSAFQSNQLFMVVTNLAALRPYLSEDAEKNRITIQGWTFDLDPNSWRQEKTDGSNTILIFKFLNKPLMEALEDVSLWEQPERFVSVATERQAAEIEAERKRLIGFFEEAIATAENGASDPLVRALTSPFWSGMVAINVNLPPVQGFPRQLQALSAGITNPDALYAKYVGSNGTPVLPQSSGASGAVTLKAEKSSLFGLLDYEDKSVPPTGPSGYAFQVSKLRVQFQNSQIIAYESAINLTLDKLFDEATLLLNSSSRRNMVVLQGFTEEHDGVISYGFSFKGENYFALPRSHILNTVDIVKAQFSTGENLSGVFTLWGRLNFRKLDAIDLFSFGSDSFPDLDFTDIPSKPLTKEISFTPDIDPDEESNEASDSEVAISVNGQLALDALVVLDERQRLSAGTEAKNIVIQYAARSFIANSAIQKKAFEIFKQLVLTPEVVDVDNVAVHAAVRAAKVELAYESLQENKQFLVFSKLAINMQPATGGARQGFRVPNFTFDSSKMTFDLARSLARPHSLYSKFPLKLLNFVDLASGQSESKPKGYIPVKTSLGKGKIPATGFGLNCELNLGSLGALAEAAQFVGKLMLVWQPNEGTQEKPTAFVGLQLPGVGGSVLGFPLQSVFKLTFKSVELLADKSISQPAYLLKIRNIAMKLFVITFPPNAQTEVVIFGDPEVADGGSKAQKNAVGWYAAYAKKPAALPEGNQSGRASPANKKRR